MFHSEAKLYAGCLLTLGALVSHGVGIGRAVAAEPSSPHWSVPVGTDAAPLPPDDTFEFEFKDLPWDKILERYSSISRLAFAGNYVPGDTATFLPPPKEKRRYTLREITEITNAILLSRPPSRYSFEAIDGKIPEKALGLKKRLELVVPKYESSYGATMKDHLNYIMDRYSGDKGDGANVLLSFTISEKAFSDAEREALWGTDFSKVQWALTDSRLDTVLEKLCGQVRIGKSDVVFTVRNQHIELTTRKLASLENSYLLVRLESSFTVLRAGQKIDSTLLPVVGVADLESRGKTELVSTVMPLKALKAADIAPDIEKQLGPFGEMVILEKANQFILRDTAGKLVQIHAMLTALENREAEMKRDKGK